jgi:hypothetical protein
LGIGSGDSFGEGGLHDEEGKECEPKKV